MLILMFTGFFTGFTIICNNSFWEIVKIDVEEDQDIAAIQNFGSDTIIIAGGIDTNGMMDIEDFQPYINISFDNGKSWQTKTDFDCNKIYKLHYKDGIILVTAFKYVRDSKLALVDEIVFFKYKISDNTWENLELPEGREGWIMGIIDEDTYIFREDKGYSYIHHSYLKTNDGGKTWTEHSLPHSLQMDRYRDMFSIKCFQGNKMWGIRTHNPYPDDNDTTSFQSLVSIDINTWEIIDNIVLGERITVEGESRLKNTHRIADIKADGETLYLLGEDEVKGNMGYVWKIGMNEKEVKVQDSFDLTDKQIPSRLFIHKDKLIVTYTDISIPLPIKTLLYKNFNEKSWHQEMFPGLIYSFMSFNNGVLMGMQRNKIYYKQF